MVPVQLSATSLLADPGFPGVFGATELEYGFAEGMTMHGSVAWSLTGCGYAADGTDVVACGPAR